MPDDFAETLKVCQALARGECRAFLPSDLAALLERYERLRKGLDVIRQMADEQCRKPTIGWQWQIEADASALLTDCPPLKE